MAPRNHKDWLKQPKMDYISSECYNNYEIFQEEQKEIFSKVWIPMCHISEMRNKGDYRTTKIADKRVIAINVIYILNQLIEICKNGVIVNNLELTVETCHGEVPKMEIIIIVSSKEN